VNRHLLVHDQVDITFRLISSDYSKLHDSLILIANLTTYFGEFDLEYPTRTPENKSVPLSNSVEEVVSELTSAEKK
jgi:hypothetical protein